MKKFLISFVFIVSVSFSALAQRTVPGQFFLGFDAMYTFTQGMSFGAGIDFGQYMRNFYWDAGVVASNRTCAMSLAGRMDLSHLYAKGGVMYRCFSTSSRSFCFYAGGGAFVGAECYDVFETLPSNYITGLPDMALLYGLYGRIEMEMFFGTNVALVLSGTVPVNFSSPGSKINGEAGVGVRFLF